MEEKSNTSRINVVGVREKWIYFLRQLLVCSGVWTLFFLTGQMMGAPTVYVPQLRKDAIALPNETLTDEMESWLYSVYGVSSIPCIFLLPALARIFGPRLPYTVACLNMLIAYLIFYFSSSPLQLLIGEIIFGLSFASVFTIGIIIIAEYTSSEYRGLFLTMKSASIYWGVWSANTIGTFFHWKCIAYPGFLCLVYTFTLVFWPDSPQWLASRGRFDECRKAFYWLQGHDECAELEVEKLIKSQVNAQNKSRLNNDWSSFSSTISTIKQREFYAPLLLSTLLVLQNNFTGKLVCSVFAIDILKKMTAQESTAYMGMLILDGVTLCAMYFGCFLTKFLKRRTLYFTTSFIGISFLFIISAYLYLVKLSVIEESQVLSVGLLVCFSLSIGAGPVIMNTSIYGELVPLRFKCVTVIITGLVFYIGMTASLKTAPFLFKNLGIHGWFLFYGIVASICTFFLYKYLPETKGKTLQEIEEYFRDSERISETLRLK